jgi:Cu/Ag efflux protein CusF
MTMVFQVKDAGVLDKVKVGDKVKFRAEKVGGGYVVTAIEAALAFTLAACAQTPTAPGSQDHSAHHPPGAASAAATPADRMTMMDVHMKAMREMHEKMSRARTPEERNALMAGHMKLMQEGMGMMGGMGPGPMAGMGGPGTAGMRAMGPMGAASAPMDMATRHQMMEKRMEMMQSMMQMMMDRMGAPPAKP